MLRRLRAIYLVSRARGRVRFIKVSLYLFWIESNSLRLQVERNQATEKNAVRSRCDNDIGPVEKIEKQLEHIPRTKIRLCCFS